MISLETSSGKSSVSFEGNRGFSQPFKLLLYATLLQAVKSPLKSYGTNIAFSPATYATVPSTVILFPIEPIFIVLSPAITFPF